jgi:repressor LexA
MTPKNQLVLDFIARFIKSHGYGPTASEIQAEFGWASVHSALRHVKALVAAGRISKQDNLARTIKIL